ncbi:putative transcription factor B3-Domain family [Helianthus anomalus]
MHVNRFFVHHKMMNTVPAYAVVIRSSTNCKWFVQMEEIDFELYVSTDWNRIKQEMSITDNHLVVLEMVDIQNFEISVFSCDPALLSFPVNCHNEAEGVPVTFRVDNHYRLPKKWAKEHGLDRKVALKIVDTVGRVWDIEVAVEFSQGCSRYYVQGMKHFVRDKNMAAGDVFQLVFVKSKCMFRFN